MTNTSLAPRPYLLRTSTGWVLKKFALKDDAIHAIITKENKGSTGYTVDSWDYIDQQWVNHWSI
jgi:hypothetical protein